MILSYFDAHLWCQVCGSLPLLGLVVTVHPLQLLHLPLRPSWTAEEVWNKPLPQTTPWCSLRPCRCGQRSPARLAPCTGEDRRTRPGTPHSLNLRSDMAIKIKKRKMRALGHLVETFFFLNFLKFWGCEKSKRMLRLLSSSHFRKFYVTSKVITNRFIIRLRP